MSQRRSIAIFILFSTATYVYADVVNTKNIIYCQSGGEVQKLDIAASHNSHNKKPVIVFTHGGAWVGGDKSFYEGDIHAVATEGFVGVSVNYRLVGDNFKNSLPAGVDDLKCAIGWLVKNSIRYGLDTKKIFLVGDSAGGHISLVTAYQLKSHIAGVVTYSAPTNMLSLYIEQREKNSSVADIVKSALGWPWPDPADDKEDYPYNKIFDLMSPSYYMGPNIPATLLIHGDQDKTIPYSQALELKSLAKRSNAQLKLITLQGEGHNFSRWAKDFSRTQMLNFIKNLLSRASQPKP